MLFLSKYTQFRYFGIYNLALGAIILISIICLNFYLSLTEPSNPIGVSSTFGFSGISLILS